MLEFEYKLRSLGFSKYEAKVLIALLIGRNMTATEIAKKAGIPRTSVYNILSDFTGKGYCNEVKTTKAMIYVMDEMESFESKLKGQFEISLNFRKQELNDFVEKIVPYIKKTAGPVEQAVELSRGYNLKREIKFENLLKMAQKEILYMNRLKGKIGKNLDTIMKQFIKKGGVVRSIYETSTNFKMKDNSGKWSLLSERGLVEFCEKFVKQGEKIKLIDELPFPVMIIDRNISFCVVVKKDYKGFEMNDLIIRNQPFSSFLADAFETYWKKAMTIEQFKKKISRKSI